MMVSVKKLFSRLALILLGFFIGLIIAEIVIRIAFPSVDNLYKMSEVKESERGKFAKYDSLLGWTGIENIGNSFEWIDTGHFVYQNKYGFRGTEYEFEKNDKRRIVCLGDSFVWGFGVENKDIFTSVIEKHSSVDVVNMGVSGYGTDQEYLIWGKQGHKWHPDDVLLLITLNNDLFDNLFDVRYNYFKPLFQQDSDGKLTLTNVPVPKKHELWGERVEKSKRNKQYKLIRYFSVVRLFFNSLSKNESIRNYLESKKYIPERLDGYDGEFLIYLKELGPESEELWIKLFKILEMLNNDVVKKGAKFHIAIIPSSIQVYPNLWSNYMKNPSIPKEVEFSRKIPNQRIIEWAQSKNIHVIDLLPGLEQAGKNNPYLYYYLNKHWTKEGHEEVAKIIIEEIHL